MIVPGGELPKPTDVLLIHPPYHARAGSGVIPPIGLAYVASALESKGISVSLLDCALDCRSQSPIGLDRFRRYVADRLERMPPSLCIGVGPTTTPALKSLYALAQIVKQRCLSVPIVYGGPFASIQGQESIFFDILEATALVRGEGEIVFPRLVDALRRGDQGKPIAGVVWDASQDTEIALVEDLDSLQFPARHLLENQRYRPSVRRDALDGPCTAIHLSRGCPYRCNFCLAPILRRGQVSRRTEDSVFAEMRDCMARFGIDGFIFYDDCPFMKSRDLNRQVQQFCAGLRDNVGAARWQIELRCDVVANLNPETLRALLSAGCVQINMGIEKATTSGLKGLNKHITRNEIVTACRHMRATVPEIRVAGTFILGGWGESENDVEVVIEFAKSLELDFAHFCPLEVYPGTSLFSETRNGGGATGWAYNVLEDSNNYWGEMLYETERLSGRRLLELTRRAYQEFYDRPEWLTRFTAMTVPEVRSEAMQIVNEWCHDRFRTNPEV